MNAVSTTAGRRVGTGLLAAAAVMLAGCSVLQPPPASAVAMPAQWSTAFPAHTAVVPDPGAWWRLFEDDLLETLIAAALADNRDLAGARARLRAARAAEVGAAARRLPTLEASASGGTRRDDVQTNRFGQPALARSFYEAGFDASWELDLFGGVAAAQAAAQADAAVAQFDLAALHVSLSAEVAREYFGLRGLQARLAVIDRHLVLQRDALTLLASRARAGLTSELDVARARADLASLEATRAPLQDALVGARLRLAVLIGQPPEATLERLATPRALPAALPLVPFALPSSLLTRRPDVRRAEAGVQAANARVGVARAALFPQFTLSGLLAGSAESGPMLSFGPGAIFMLAPSVRLPIFNAGRLRADVAIRDAVLAEALAAYDGTLLGALAEVERAASGLRHAEERRRASHVAVQEAAHALDLARTQQARGLVDYFAVIDAERTQVAADDALARADTVRLQHLVALYKALGGGWQPAPALASR